jgi:prepilin-type N-terminal cleavage/methylation domain-containing protein
MIKREGFTIVELLIVIVVIGILAAITIVSFNGVTSRANAASLQSDLESDSKLLAQDAVLSGSDTFPSSLAAANQGKGITASSGTTLQYNQMGTDYCLTGVKGTAIYHVSPSAGTGSGGCTITNLFTNPNLETNATNWSNNAMYTGLRTQINGSYVFQATRNTATSATAIYISTTTPIAVTPGMTYTASATVTSSVDTSALSLRLRLNNTTTDFAVGSAPSITAGVPTRLTVSGVVPSGTTSASIAMYSATGAVNDVQTVDNVMFTVGTYAYTYADGSTAGWSWSGTTNGSTSSGPSLP